MRTIEERNRVMELHAQGKNNSEISRITGIPRCTVRDITIGKYTKAIHRLSDKFSVEKFSEEQKSAYAYILGQYLGDGCIDLGPRGVYRMRIASDCKYPNIIQEIKDKFKIILPNNKPMSNVVMNNGKPSCDHVTVYSKHLFDMFPQHADGKKHDREIKLTDWQQSIVDTYPKEFLRGLIHSDGSRFYTTKSNNYSYSFNNVSMDIISLCQQSLDKLEVKYSTTKKPISGKMTREAYVVYIRIRKFVNVLDSFIGAKT